MRRTKVQKICKKHEVSKKKETIKKSGTMGFIEFPRGWINYFRIGMMKQFSSIISLDSAIWKKEEK